MKIPSLQRLLAEAVRTAERFPMSLLAAFLATAAAMMLLDNPEPDKIIIKGLMTSALGISFFLSVQVFSESRGFDSAKRWLSYCLAAALLAAYFLSLPDDLNAERPAMRYFVLFLSSHALVSFIPFLSSGNVNAFWQYNKAFFIRILTAGLYSGVLYAGLALAITAVQELFKIEMDSKIYANLWFFLVGIFNTWFFLAGLPDDMAALEQDQDYPKGLKLFTQYVLIPLVTLYLVILYAYTLKIAIEMRLPKDWVSYLVISFSIAGILALLLVHPLRRQSDSKWILFYNKWFYWALFPLIALLFISIGLRVADYGITEKRYFVLILAFWLMGISIYMLFNKSENIKMVPLTLFVVAFLSVVGPFSAFEVSERSQLRQLYAIFEREDLLDEGIFQPERADSLSQQTRDQIQSIVIYLVDKHGQQTLQPFLAIQVDTISADDYSVSKEILEHMKVGYYGGYGDGEGQVHYGLYCDSESEQAFSVKGFDAVVFTSISASRTPEEAFEPAEDNGQAGERSPVTLSFSEQSYALPSGDSLRLRLGIDGRLWLGLDSAAAEASYDLAAFYNRQSKPGENYVYDLDLEKMTLTSADSTATDFGVQVRSMTGYYNTAPQSFESIDITVRILVRQP